MRMVIGHWWRGIAITIPEHGRFRPVFAYVPRMLDLEGNRRPESSAVM